MQLPAIWREQPLDRKIGGVLTVLTVPLALVVVPFIYFLLKAALGLLALIAAGAAGFALWQFLPLINMKITNMVLKLMKIEARKNPIETLEKQRIAVADRLVVVQKKYSLIKAAAGDFRSGMNAAKRDFPEEDYSEEETTAERLDQMVIDLEGQLHDGQTTFALYERKVASSKRKYELKLKVLAVKAEIGELNGQAVLDDILREEAFDEVATGLNLTLTEIETRLSDQNLLSIGRRAGKIPLTLPKAREMAVVRK